MIGKVGYSYSHELLKHIEKVGNTINKGGCPMDFRELTTDVLVIGGGTAGCYAAITLGQEKDVNVLIVEKANIKRSGCLAAGVNAINAYITEGHVPQDYVDYAKKDADGIVREDLLLSMSERLNEVTAHMEHLGLVILKDKDGKYVARGNRNIKINGENIKPILAEAVKKLDNTTVINHVNITDYIVEDGVIKGAYGFDVNDRTVYKINAKAVICATGGAAGLYRPNNPGFSRHKMWYPPFNTGAGYAMGIKAGAEMTTFEMRFIALRCKDTIAPTGTIAQGVHAKQLNSAGEIYEDKYGITTSQRLYGTVTENKEGRGPCYLKTDEISDEQQSDLYKAYLNMAPSQTLKWIESGRGPKNENVEIEGTTASPSDYIWYTGTSECQVGENVRTITVTDVDGNAATYTVTIIRAAGGDEQQTQTAQKKDSSDTSSAVSKNANVMDQYKKMLNTALAIVLIVLVIALVVIIIWIRGKIKGGKKDK